MERKNLEKIINIALENLEAVVPDMPQILSDLKEMRLSFRNRGGDIDSILQNKETLLRQMWKLGKVHELMQNNLLNSNGTLTKEAFNYLERQRQGKNHNSFFPGEVQIEFSIINLDKLKIKGNN